MKKILMLGFCLVAIAPQAHAQSAEYTEGYNAGRENVPPPPGYSDEYFAGWQAAQREEQGLAMPGQPSADQQTEPSDDNQPE